ncbi:MAG: oligosaccharide flippase family protein [Fibrella sp.]|nr:oligosaccharide flippase family protein [Armatimonadota bacterium]
MAGPGRVRRGISRVFQKLLGYSGYFQLYNFPFQYALSLYRGTGIVTVAWINLGTMLLEYVAYVVLVFRCLPGIRIHIALADRTLLREVASFSLSQLLVHAATLVRMRIDPLLVQWFLTLPAVAVYAIALRISESTLLLTKQVINVFAPLVAQLQGSGDVIKLRFILLNATKFVFAASTVLTLSVCLFAREIIVLWVGSEMAAAAIPLCILMAAMGLNVPQMMVANVLVMTGHHKLSAQAQGAGILVNLACSILLAPFWVSAASPWAH